MCDECTFRLVEFPIYGLGRVGVAMPDINIDTDVPPTTVFTRRLNRKFYELTDHLGNVRAVLGDRKRTASPGTGPYFGEIRSYSHVYPFGMPQPGRTWDSLSDYRYGYNGMETDPEVKEGSGKHYTTYFRQYDPRLGRWWSHDPVTHSWESPYVAMFNNPIGFSDPFGADPDPEDPPVKKDDDQIDADGSVVTVSAGLTSSEASAARQRGAERAAQEREEREFRLLTDARRAWGETEDLHDDRVVEWSRNQGMFGHFAGTMYLTFGGSNQQAAELIAEDQILGFIPGVSNIQAGFDIAVNGVGFWNVVSLLPIPELGVFDDAAEGIVRYGDEGAEAVEGFFDSRKITAGPTRREIADLPQLPQSRIMNGDDRILYRFGDDIESATRLERKAQEAEDIIGVHGVSTTTKKTSGGRPYSSATMKEVKEHFDVIQTGKDPNHHTVVLPKPVDSNTAKKFNKVFGRIK